MPINLCYRITMDSSNLSLWIRTDPFLVTVLASGLANTAKSRIATTSPQIVRKRASMAENVGLARMIHSGRYAFVPRVLQECTVNTSTKNAEKGN